MNPSLTVGGRFAANVVGGGVPDARGGVKTPPYDAKDKGSNGKAAGRACPAPTGWRERVVPERGKGGRQPAPSKLAGGYPLIGGGVKPVGIPQAATAASPL